MKRFALLAILAALAATTAHAGWWRTYGGEGYDVGNCVQITSDGNYIIAGNKADSLWLLKVDTLGQVIWSKAYEGYANWLEETEDGGFIVCGSPDLMKVTSEGDSVWAQDYGIQAQCVQVVDGGYVVTGYSGIGEDRHIWLIKADETGDSIWAHNYEYPERNWNKSYFVQRTSDGGYILTGETGINTEEFGTAYLWVAKTGSEGILTWTKEYGDGEISLSDRGRCVRQSTDGGYIIVGYTDKGSGVWLLKTDPQGDTTWTKLYGDQLVGEGHSVLETSDGGYILVGSHVVTTSFTAFPARSNLWLLKTNNQGDTLWTRLYGNEETEDLGYCVQQTVDEGYIITGRLGYDLYLLRTDSLGLLGIKEEPVVKEIRNWRILKPIGTRIILSYKDRPDGFHANIFDAVGRKADALNASTSTATLTWGSNHPAGVYFIQVKEANNKTKTERVILIR